MSRRRQASSKHRRGREGADVDRMGWLIAKKWPDRDLWPILATFVRSHKKFPFTVAPENLAYNMPQLQVQTKLVVIMIDQDWLRSMFF